MINSHFAIRNSKHSRVIVVALLLLLVAAGFFGYTSALRVKYRADAALGRLRNAEAIVEEGILQKDTAAKLVVELKAAEASLTSAREEPVVSLLRLLGWVPRLGPQAEAVVVLLDSSSDMAAAGRLVLEALAPAAELMGGEGTPALFGNEDVAAKVVAVMASTRMNFEAAEKRLEVAKRRLNSLSRPELDGRLSDALGRLDRLLPPLQRAAKLGRLAPGLMTSLLGMAEPKRYLVVAQNNDELRATGGFIGSVWLIGVQRGKVTEVDFKDSADVDDLSKRYPPPPPAIGRYLFGGVWVFRDANWSPDFPTSARLIEDFYKLGQGIAVDGVIALDQRALESILSLTGPVFVRDFDELVDSSNVFDKIVHASGPVASPAFESLRPKKLFGKALFEELLGKFQSGMDTNMLVKLTRIIGKNLDDKRLLLYFNDEAVQAVLRDARYDGAIRPSQGDFLMVVDSNVAYRKINPLVQESIAYQVSLEREGANQGKVAIRYRNNSAERLTECIQDTLPRTTYEQWREGCYWDYLRVYVPKEANLLQASNIPLPKGSFLSRLGNAPEGNEAPLAAPEGEKQVFDTFFDLRPGASREVFFTYRLPSSVVQRDSGMKRYDLLVQKQPGTANVSIQVAIDLPQGAKLVSVEPAPQKVTGQRVEFQAGLARDLRFVITFSAD